MPDLPNRRKYEEDLATVLLVLFDELRRADDLSVSGNFIAGGVSAVRPILAEVHQKAAAEVIRQEKLDIDQDVANERVADRAALAAMVLIDDMLASTATRLQNGATIDEATTPERAVEIATSAVTDSVSIAELLVIGMFNSAAIAPLKPIWWTEKDGMVCPICRPLHKRPKTFWQHLFPNGPKAHPNCRCWLEYTLQ